MAEKAEVHKEDLEAERERIRKEILAEMEASKKESNETSENKNE